MEEDLRMLLRLVPLAASQASGVISESETKAKLDADLQTCIAELPFRVLRRTHQDFASYMIWSCSASALVSS